MPNERKLARLDLADTAILMGSPPVLSTEDPKQFESMLAKLVACLEPQGIIETMLIGRYAEATWVSRRYARHATIAVDRRYRQLQQTLTAKLKQQAEKKAAIGGGGLVQSGAKPADIAHLIDLEENILGAVVSCDAIMEHAATEIDHNRAIEGCLALLERLDKLESGTIARADDALQILEHHREGLGRRVREKTQAIIDAEFRETEKTPAISYPATPQ